MASDDDFGEDVTGGGQSDDDFGEDVGGGNAGGGGGGGSAGNAGGNDSGGGGGDDNDDDGSTNSTPDTSPSGTGEGSETLSTGASASPSDNLDPSAGTTAPPASGGGGGGSETPSGGQGGGDETTTIAGPAAPSNPAPDRSDEARVVEGSAAAAPGTAPAADDATAAGDEGLEDRGFGNVGAKDGATSEAVEQLQAKIDRKVPGVLAVETGEYDITRTGTGGLKATLTESGRRDAVATARVDGDAGGVLGNDAEGGGEAAAGSGVSVQQQRRRPGRRQSAEGAAERAQDAFAARNVTRVPRSVQDDVGSAEAAQDAAAAGLLATEAVGEEGAAEAASDLAAAGLIETGPGESRQTFRGPAGTIIDPRRDAPRPKLVSERGMQLTASDAAGTGRRAVATNDAPIRDVDVGDVPLQVPTRRESQLRPGDVFSTGTADLGVPEGVSRTRAEILLQRQSKAFQRDVKQFAERREVTQADTQLAAAADTRADADPTADPNTGSIRGIGDVADVSGAALGAKEAAEAAAFLGGGVTNPDASVSKRANTLAGQSAVTAQQTAEQVKESPTRVGTAVATGALVSAPLSVGASRAAGAAIRGARDRLRTVGGERLPASDLASDEVIQFQETGGETGEQFPGFDDKDLATSDPARAFREQAQENTPEEVEQRFSEAGVEQGVDAKKALDTEPEGPGTGRAGQGIKAPDVDTEEASQFESPGSFFGPEVSPNFLRLGSERSRVPSIGLPDFGNRPTAVVARTDVENPDAETMSEFNQELEDRAGETTLRTKPADEVNPGEAEAVAPPGAEFEAVTDRGLLNRLGIGSEFFTEIDGRRVPVRLVRPADGDGDGSDAPTGDTAVSRRQQRGSLDELSERVRQPEDDALAPVPLGSGGSATSGRESNSQQPSGLQSDTDPLARPSRPDASRGDDSRGLTGGGRSQPPQNSRSRRPGSSDRFAISVPRGSPTGPSSRGEPREPVRSEFGPRPGSPGGSGGGSSGGGSGGGGGGGTGSTVPPEGPGIPFVPFTPPETSGRPPTGDSESDPSDDDDDKDAGVIQTKFLKAVGDPVNLAFGFSDPTDREPASTPIGEGFSDLEAAAERQAPDAAIQAISEDVRGNAEAFGIQDGTEFRFEVGRR